ncbi:MAG: hypothetical protein K2W92_04020, partial [Alphaproteobacteria bacterium]|nr:hypothetical protein [Alphaproteobacteria bacterium]
RRRGSNGTICNKTIILDSRLRGNDTRRYETWYLQVQWVYLINNGLRKYEINISDLKTFRLSHSYGVRIVPYKIKKETP